ncbi:MAG: preprotein translocase subunit YajC [Bacteroidota bacterium]
MSPQLMKVLPGLVLMILMLVMFWWTIVRPAKQRQESHQKLVDAVKEGDQIVTAGGIYGRITKLRDKWIELEVAQGVRIKFDRRTIRRVAEDDE